jgi:hypothetical protein
MPRSNDVLPSELTPDMPVIVTGVSQGQLLPIEQWPRGEIPSQEFPNLAAAQKVFPDLALKRCGARFEGPTVDTVKGSVYTRFDSQAVWDRLAGR